MAKAVHGNSKYTPKLAKAICDRLACGESLRAVCRDPEMPNTDTVYQWLYKATETDVDPESDLARFPDQYARAREHQSDVEFDAMAEIAEGNGTDENVNRDRLRIDTMKWNLARKRPRKYGDRIMQEHSGDIALSANVRVEVVDTRERAKDEN